MVRPNRSDLAHDYIVTVTITRYEDVVAKSDDSARHQVQKTLTQRHGPNAKITKVEKG